MVTIEPIALHHAPELQPLASHPEVTATTLLPEPYPPNGAEEWVRHILCQAHPPAARPFLIRADGTAVGGCGFKDVSKTAGEAEYGYWIGRPYWGRGYATAAGRLALAIAFEQWNLQYVFAQPLSWNKASCRVLDKLGFERTGLRPNPFPKWKPTDQVAYYEISRERWLLLREG